MLNLLNLKSRNIDGNIYRSDVYGHFNIYSGGWNLDQHLRDRLYNYVAMRNA